VKQPYHREGKSYYSNHSREDKWGGRLSLRVAHAPNDNGKLVDTEGRNSPILVKKSPAAAALALLEFLGPGLPCLPRASKDHGAELEYSLEDLERDRETHRHLGSYMPPTVADTTPLNYSNSSGHSRAA
jgi:hypothetical protein